MHAGVGYVVLPDQFALGIRIYVVLVAVEALAVLLGPARILVFLPVFCRVLLPSLGRFAALYVLILVPAIPLLGNRNDRGINHLTAARNVAFRFQMLAKALEQLLNQTSLRKRFAEQPQCRAVRNAILDAEPQKARERQPVAHLILDLLVGQIVKRLQHQHPKHHENVNRLAPGIALLLVRRRHTAASISARKLSNGTTRAIISSGSPFAEIAASRLSASKNPNCPIAPPANLYSYKSDSHKFGRRRYFSRCP